MKKIILMFVAVLAFSCSDDKTPEPAVDPIVGTWKPVSEILRNTQANTTENSYQICNANTRFTFTSSGSLINIISEGEDASDCETFSLPNITYTKVGNVLTLFQPGVVDTDPSTVTFSNGNNTMTLVFLEDVFVNTITYTRQ